MNTLLDRSSIPFVPGLGENDILSDCTVVALVNSARAASWVKHGCDLNIDWSAVVAWFAKIANVTPDLPAEKAVRGLYPRDVLAYAVRYGVSAGLQAPLMLRASTSIPPEPVALYRAMRGGTAYVEIGLCADDEASAACMDALTGPIVGLHQIILWDCTGLGPDDLVIVGTWGRWQFMTWRGLQARVQGAWQLEWVLP